MVVMDEVVGGSSARVAVQGVWCGSRRAGATYGARPFATRFALISERRLAVNFFHSSSESTTNLRVRVKVGG